MIYAFVIILYLSCFFATFMPRCYSLLSVTLPKGVPYGWKLGPCPNWGYADHPPSPQFWSNFYGRCAMCWIELKINFLIFIFRVIVKIHRKMTVFSTKRMKNDKKSKNRNRKNLEYYFSFDSAHSTSFM